VETLLDWRRLHHYHAIICVRKDPSAFMGVEVLHLLVWDEMSAAHVAQLIPRYAQPAETLVMLRDHDPPTLAEIDAGFGCAGRRALLNVG
jgi:hypothetical protein